MNIKRYNSSLLELKIEKTDGTLNDNIIISPIDLLRLKNYLNTVTYLQMKDILEEK